MGLNDDSPSTKSTINLELFQNIFERIEPDIKIDNYEESHGSDRGDNYTAELYRIILKGNIKVDGKKQKWEKSVICKRLPECKIQRETYKSELLFRNEVQFYTKILPELTRFQKTRSTEFQFNAVPQCYLARNDLLILEDLCVRNYEMANRIEGLDLEQMQAVLTELAKFHALSLAYKHKHPQKFSELTELISEGIFTMENIEWYKNYYDRLTKNAIEMVTSSFSENSKYVVKLKEFSDSLFLKMVQLLGKATPLQVICHGDCWTNNILYQHNEKQEIIGTCLVDFQLIRAGSLTLDLANIIYCCTDLNLRRDHMVSLLQLYDTELKQSLLQLLGQLPDYCSNDNDLWTMIQEDFKIFGKFGLGLSMDILPISTCSANEAPDLYDNDAADSLATPILNVLPNALCKRKMCDLVQELVDADLI